MLYASADAKHRKDKQMSSSLEQAVDFSMFPFVLMFFCLKSPTRAHDMFFERPRQSLRALVGKITRARDFKDEGSQEG